jgi:hypothetical protein
MNVSRRHEIMRYALQSSVAIALWLATACAGSETIDIGEGRARPPGVVGASLVDYAGDWVGYAEAFTWSDGSDRVRIALDANGVGTLRIGEAPDLPPPDPMRGYPPESEHPNNMGHAAPPIVPGFEYQVHAARVESQRIRFAVATGEVYSEWCAMQTTTHRWFGSDPPQYSCMSDWSWSGSFTAPAVCTAFNGADPEDSESVPQVVNCGVTQTCSSRCVCNDTSCIGIVLDDVRVDAAIREDGEALEGTFVLDESRIIVRLMRM